MASDAEVRQAIAEYERSFRHPDRERLEVSPGLYDLWPESNRIADVTADWSGPWPFADRAGVYLIFNGQRQLLWVGSAWKLGPRLYQHFGAGPACKISGWSSPPRYVIIVAVPTDMRFEASMLEEYLILQLHPCDNRAGLQKGMQA